MDEPKQERAVKTREAILYAAAEVFDTYGYSGASISKIMERAQVTQGGMYFHFKSKLGLAQAVLAHQQEFVHFPPQGHDGLQLLIDLNFFLARELQTNVLFRASVRLAVEQGDFGMRDDTAYQEWVDQFHGLLCAARERGELLPGVDEREFANVLVGAYSGIQVFSNVASGRADLHSRLVSMWRYFLPAIATPQAIAELRFPQDVQEFAA
ncbi:ScbR family autoregulator-binding transcription factor [Streptomyces sp. NK15101]|uniref:ScbR family autoregulator-binding transcription factor n=1 Tax=Streptomyces sp. NK15101 TaxID=2873261 RepID=UPI001CECEA59|nr:ScbR family autoregulator-binding transcription factor [Streptomyces sp. NK15101]